MTMLPFFVSVHSSANRSYIVWEVAQESMALTVQPHITLPFRRNNRELILDSTSAKLRLNNARPDVFQQFYRN